jgi:polyphosphate kinase
MDALNSADPASLEIAPDSPRRFINRELSWLAFNTRVLEEATNKRHPLLERVRFLSISAANLDEFYMVRVAGLVDMLQTRSSLLSDDGMTPVEQLSAIRDRASTLMGHQQDVWALLQDDLRQAGIAVLDADELTETERSWLDTYFIDQVFPILTPLAIDPAHPFPFIPNGGFSAILKLQRRDDRRPLMALLPLPPQVDRFVRLPGPDIRFLPLEDLIDIYLPRLFPGYEVIERAFFRVIRDSDVEINEEAEDLVLLYESALKRRRRGDLISISVNSAMPAELRDFLFDQLEIQEQTQTVHVFHLDRMLNADRRRPAGPEVHALQCRASPSASAISAATASRRSGSQGHHRPPPYESFDVVVQFLRQAARDPDVVAIKQTLYRTSRQPDRAQGADRGGGGRQVRDRAGRAEGALRRGGEHPLGARSGARRRAGRLRLHRAQDPRQDLAGGAARGGACAPTSISAPATTIRSRRRSTPTCPSSPAIRRCAATRPSLFNYMTGYAAPEQLEKIAFARPPAADAADS